jgi:hypothetical protein
MAAEFSPVTAEKSDDVGKNPEHRASKDRCRTPFSDLLHGKVIAH